MTVLMTPTGPVTVDTSGTPKLSLTRLQAAITALGIAAGSAIGALVIPAAQPVGCVQAVQVFYSNERAPFDTVWYVPPKGSLRDSLLLADSIIGSGNKPLRDVDAIYVSSPVRVCADSTGPVLRPVLAT